MPPTATDETTLPQTATPNATPANGAAASSPGRSANSTSTGGNFGTSTGSARRSADRGGSSGGQSSGGLGKTLLTLGLVGGAIAAAVVIVPAAINSMGDGQPKSNGAVTTGQAVVRAVGRAPFLVTRTVQGHLDSQSNVTLSSEVEGETTIITIVPEGRRVKEGDLVVELDSSALREKYKQQQIDVTQAEAKLAQAQENLEIQQTQNLSDIAAAELNWKLAQLDLEKYREGEYPQEEKALSGEVALAEEESLRAEENYEFSRSMVKKGYKTPNEAEADRIAVRSAELKLQQAREKLKVLTEYTKKRQIAELTANATEYERELERVKLKAKAAETQAQAELDAARLTHEVESEKLEKSERLIDATRIYAPQAGEVVYANDEGRGFRSDGPQIEEGAKVRERQAIVKLPDTRNMQVECRIHESLIGRISEGLPAKVRVDAYPDREFEGKVAEVSNVPMSGRFPNYDLREYETNIALTGAEELVRDLRPGLTAQVEIIIDDRDSVLQVPQQAIVTAGDKKVVFVADPTKASGTESRYIKIGAVNDSYAEILDGIAEGDKVVLNPRNRFSARIEELEKLHRPQADESGRGERAGGEEGERRGPPGAGRPGGGRPQGAGGGGRPSGGGGRPGGGGGRPGGNG